MLKKSLFIMYKFTLMKLSVRRLNLYLDEINALPFSVSRR